MIETQRLVSLPLGQQELRTYINHLPDFEASHDLQPSYHQHTEDLLWMVSAITEPTFKFSQNISLYYTIWVVYNKATQQLVADWGFKGPPDAHGSIEIGYGTHPGQRGRGYMTEIVGGIVAWARQHPPIRQVRAETELTNLASQAVLRHNKFVAGAAYDGLIPWSYTI